MSLINDALKRAKRARPEQPAAASPNLPFRPVEPEPRAARRGLGLVLPVSLALVALLTLLLLWELSNRNGSSWRTEPKGHLAVAARALPHAARASMEVPSPTSSALPGVIISGSSKTVFGSTPEGTATASINSSSPDSSFGQAASGTNSVLSGKDGPGTNHAGATEPPPAVPSPLKLQGIIFNPKRPSAMISGRVIFLGDRIRDLRVMAIHPDCVVLAGAGRTNLLSLEP